MDPSFSTPLQDRQITYPQPPSSPNHIMSSPPTATSSFHPRLLRPFSPTTMSMSQTFRLAHQARGKLSYEANQQDHDLRLLVGHANLLDQLMLHLADNEHKQQQWFEHTVEQNVEEREEHTEEQDPVYGSLATDWPSDEDSSSDSESEDEYEEEENDDFYARHRNYTRVHVKEIYAIPEEDESLTDDDDDEDGLYSLTRTTSHHGGPPSLCSDLSEDEDDDTSPPPSPPTLSIPIPPPSKIPVLNKSKSSPAAVPAMHTGWLDDHHEAPRELHTHEDHFFDHYLAGPITTF